MGGKKKVTAVRSLGDLQKFLDAHASEKKFKVRVKALRGICDATSMSEILRHQEAAKKWIVLGMKGLEALVVVDGMVGDASQLLNQAIAHMEIIVASAAGSSSTTPTGADSDSDADAETLDPAFPSARRLAREVIVDSADGSTDADAETLVPAFPSARRLAREDKASMDLAQRMIEAGLGLCGGPLIPCAALLDLATRTLGDEGPSGVIDLSADTIKAGPADAAKPAPVVCGLGAKDNSPTAKLAPAVCCLGAKGAMESAVAADMSAILVPNARRLEDPFITFGAEDDSVDTDDQATLALAERMMEAGTGRRGVPGPAIRQLAKRVLAADVITTFDITRDDGIAHAPAADLSCLGDVKTMELAERMLEAGTGRRGPPCVPSPAILQLAAHVVTGDSLPRDLGDSARHVFTRLLDSGTALRNHRLSSSVTQRAVQGLGARIEDLATAVLTSRHPPASYSFCT